MLGGNSHWDGSRGDTGDLSNVLHITQGSHYSADLGSADLRFSTSR